MLRILRRIKALILLIKNREELIMGKSYYPNCKLKSRIQILCDHIYIIMKYGKYEPFYFTYGFDRKEMTLDHICNNYIIPYSLFQQKIDKLNIINPIYGRYNGRTITADKFYFSIFLDKFNIPTPKVYCYIRKKQIVYMSRTFKVDDNLTDLERLKMFLSYDMDAFAKPADGQLGNGIFALKIANGQIYVDGKPAKVEALLEKLLSADYLVQERVYQHPKMSALCPDTLNSIRLQTIMSPQTGEVTPFAAGLRIGRYGSSVDNWAKGGIFVGIDMKNGQLYETGYLKPTYGTSTNRHLDSGIIFKGYEIPYFQEAVNLAIKLHTAMYRCHSIGWDIAITEKGPIFIEGNGLWEISLLQAAHGGLKNVEKYFNYK